MQRLNFRVSSHLKSIIGRDLITDDFVAVFELVKNSFDAGASEVTLSFIDNKLYIIDNGKGMSYDDLVNKWLFVAYSAKQDGTEDGAEGDYREHLGARRYAGSKGVGRFSCDRLGERLLLQTKKQEGMDVNSLEVVWGDFEKSSQNDFINIDIKHSVGAKFNLPLDVNFDGGCGTVLEISGLREAWGRAKLKELKSSLAKLINPFGSQKENFAINIEAENEKEEDDRLRRQSDELPPNEIINGPVENFIFQTLQEKTTWLRVFASDEKIITELVDRGKLIYRISENNSYEALYDAGFECNLFYLNRSAKATFARRMGINSVSFGSVFLFKNGFRVYPIGEESDDTFGIDRRKQQGYSRYLGTRDILGRIDVIGDDSKFKESSSRDKGLIETNAYAELHDAFWKKCFLRLENYVVGVSWRIKYDTDLSDASHLTRDEVKARIIDVISRLASSPEISVEYFSDDILSIVDHKSNDFDKTIDNLSSIAKRLGDDGLLSEARNAKIRFQEMLRAEAEAIEFAEKERTERLAAEKFARATEKELKKEKEINLFLTSLQSHDKDVLEGLHHQVIIYASNSNNLIEAGLLSMANGRQLSQEYFQGTLESLLLLNQQIIAASRFATKANFKMDSNSITVDFPVYIEQYVEKICKIYRGKVSISVQRDISGFDVQFKPIELSIIIDNIVDNAIKAGATKIDISITKPHSNAVSVLFTDDGSGVPLEITDMESIFNKGVTTTQGSGLGLYNVRQLLQGINGTISLIESSSEGATFEIKVYK